MVVDCAAAIAARSGMANASFMAVDLAYNKLAQAARAGALLTPPRFQNAVLGNRGGRILVGA
jgi:hypothetical protein